MTYTDVSTVDSVVFLLKDLGIRQRTDGGTRYIAASDLGYQLTNIVEDIHDFHAQMLDSLTRNVTSIDCYRHDSDKQPVLTITGDDIDRIEPVHNGRQTSLVISGKLNANPDYGFAIFMSLMWENYRLDPERYPDIHRQYIRIYRLTPGPSRPISDDLAHCHSVDTNEILNSLDLRIDSDKLVAP